MGKPQNIIYQSFSSSIENKTQGAEEQIKNIKHNLRSSWSPTVESPNKEGSLESSCLDADKIVDKFDRQDLQDAYAEYLTNSEQPPIEATTIKFQNGFIAADEQAYRIRHYSLPRALSAGLMDNKRWANGLMKHLLENRIQSIQALAQTDYDTEG